MQYKNKHDSKIEEKIVESLIHQAQIKSGNTGVEKAVSDKKAIGTAKLASERVTAAIDPAHKKFNNKRNRKRREKRALEKRGMSETMRGIIDNVANAKDLVAHITGKKNVF
jgi:hypothetical protein